MTRKIFFTVVIPVYNREQHIAHAVQSVLQQDHDAFELIIVNDGSTDGTLGVLNSFTDSRLRIINRENGERGAARNTGTEAAQGEYITFLDSDDEFLNGHLRKAEEFISSQPKQINMFCTGYLKESANGIEEIKIPVDIKNELYAGNFLSCNGVFLKRETAIHYRFSENRVMSGLEDWELWLRITAQEQVAGKNLMSSRMRYHEGRSVLNTHPVEIENRFKVFVQEVERNGILKNSHAEKTFMASCESYMALHLAMTGKFKSEARQHLNKAFRWKPDIVFSRRFYAILKHLV